MLMVNALLKDSEEDNILKLLASIDVCKRCAVRIFKGNYGDYQVDKSETPVKRGSHCCACLGILEGSTLLAVAKKVAEKLEEVDYDSSTFQTGVALPQCLILRQASIITYLIDNGITGVHREFTNVKTVARFFLNRLIEKFTKKRHDPHSEFFIKLDFNFSADATEISKIETLLRSSQQRKTKNTSGKRSNDGTVKNFQQQYSFESIHRVVKALPDMEVKKYATCPPNPLAEACDFNVSMSHASIYIGGRYNKYSRELSQTPWSVDGMRKGETSTLELIGEKLKVLCKATGMKFQSAGREDVDVRMLGKGRPFAVELTDPKITVVAEEDMRKLQIDINSSTDMISVRDLQKVNRAGLELMKKGEEEKVKTYRAKLWCPVAISDEKIKILNTMKDIDLHQKTPIRVLHRRPIRTRIRKIQEIELVPLENEEGHYEVNLKSQAGTYIKEFVHGDFGRTDPSLRTLLDAPIDILELDVTSIDLDWPPELANRTEINGASKDAKDDKPQEMEE